MCLPSLLKAKAQYVVEIDVSPVNPIVCASRQTKMSLDVWVSGLNDLEACLTDREHQLLPGVFVSLDRFSARHRVVTD